MAVTAQAETFRSLHVPGRPLLMPNPWDVGTARLLSGLGFRALATTSSGFAATLGRPDGHVTRDESLAHAAAVVAAVDVPVSADLENGFADDPDGVRTTVERAVSAGLAGCSIEDFSGNPAAPIYDAGLAAERIAAAATATGDSGLVLTGRAENLIRGNPDLADTIARLQAYQAAGADVLFAPGLARLADIRSVVSSVDRPVNVLVRPGLADVAALAEAGVARISVGGAFSRVALGALALAGRELLDEGSYGFLDLAAEGGAAIAAHLANAD
jgi:2-methylisocitrate lyase-like PEP mutase family enzyme